MPARDDAPRTARIRPRQTVLAYLLLALAWLGASDLAVAKVARTPLEWSRWSLGKGIAFVLATGAVLFALLRKAASDLSRSNSALAESEARYRRLVQSSPDGIVIVQGARVAFVNGAAERLFGGSAAALVGRPAADFAAPEQRASVKDCMERIERGAAAEPVAVRRMVRLDGSSFVAEVEAGAFELLGRPAVHLVVRDVTADMEEEQERGRVTWTMRLVSACDEVMVRATSEDALLAEVCRVAMDVGGLRMAWVGFAEDDEAKSIRPVAWSGVDAAERLTLWKPSWSADAWGGSGPAGRAIRSGAAVVVRDVRAEPALAKVADELRSAGFVSAAVLPLEARGRRIGAFALYASEPGVFDDARLDLLKRLGENLGSVLAGLRERRAREAAEASLLRRNEELRTLAARLQTVREEEQARISRDLHDELGQLLTGLQLDLQRAEAAAGQGAGSGRTIDLLAGASALVTRAVASVRRIATELRPQVLDRIGLGAALQEEAHRVQERSGLECDVDVPEDLGPLPAEVATALYRIAQEALTNVVRHAGATRVAVRLRVDLDELVLQVEDDGRGLPALAGGPRGLGTLGMQERALRLGGELTLGRGPRGGALVTARVPVGAQVRAER